MFLTCTCEHVLEAFHRYVPAEQAVHEVEAEVECSPGGHCDMTRTKKTLIFKPPFPNVFYNGEWLQHSQQAAQLSGQGEEISFKPKRFCPKHQIISATRGFNTPVGHAYTQFHDQISKYAKAMCTCPHS